ncbi:glycoside hydrolase family 38 C-terminal domain-containing protein [Microbacterium luteolum]|uniref:Alpha-mannosidase n=1 Tax=Microbacterium luteolum TaxID=69367 RepID=A0ABY7XLJ8_MICLT|nr:glycoside hydrolase family 38 C-terminal domain-containing protein [Microbacterium luteolum]WDM42786.1 alpha-mannosidase [Microbacterium luteolum]
MHDNSSLVEARIQRFAEERLHPAVYARTQELELRSWSAPGEPVPFAEAVVQTFVPFSVGSSWGRAWSTMWLHVIGVVPTVDDGQRAELIFDLGFNGAEPGFQAEGTVYRPDGSIVKAVEPRNAHVPLEGTAGDPIDLYLEAAANPDIAAGWTFAPTPFGQWESAGEEPLYVLRRADIGILDVTVWELLQDVAVLRGLMGALPAESPRRAEILRALERMIDVTDPEDVAGTAVDARAELVGVLARPASASAHSLHAVGHAHIDSAWLWPVRETQRKVARTFSNVLSLQQADPDFAFAASSAQQYAWMKQFQPELFARMREAVAAGRFVPAGGMWVESDTNMPGGEALARQFVRGKRFFLEEFGVEPLDVWLPDSFGYSAALPQIARAAGSRWMLTQKMSWNETNVMPHHTFLWEGIDGTRIFTHFPPVDTYNAQLTGEELARAERQYAEKGVANTSLVPFGYGDGGGGPNREMVAAATRLRSLEGSPTVTLSTPRRFFEAAEAEYPAPPVWSGEMYLEFHRGTYTSQSRTKRGNRRSEHTLKEAELWATAAALRGEPYPYDELDAAWETVLLQQFHDILPGSSIGWVHREAERRYAEVLASTERIIAGALAVVAGSGDTELVADAGPYAKEGTAAMGISAVQGTGVPAAVARTTGGFVLENEHLTVSIDDAGLVTSLVARATGRDAIAAGERGNLLQLHRDTPSRWDAWDIDEHYRRHVVDVTDVVSIDIVPHPSAAIVCVVRALGGSRITQALTLPSGGRALDITTTVDWHERQKLLKLAFPFDVHTDRATSEIQFGHVHRPTHTNTSWDAARFETVAHRWVHVGEPGFGVAVANDATYGHDITRTSRSGGGTATTVRLSLLRAPLFPDPDADQGEHTFTVSVRPDATIADAIREGYRLNLPVRALAGAGPVAPLLDVSSDAVVVEAVKLAEDRSGDVIVRLYEAHGGRAAARLSAAFDFAAVAETDLLEREIDATAVRAVEGRAVDLELRAFQLVTLRFRAPALPVSQPE